MLRFQVIIIFFVSFLFRCFLACSLDAVYLWKNKWLFSLHIHQPTTHWDLVCSTSRASFFGNDHSMIFHDQICIGTVATAPFVFYSLKPTIINITNDLMILISTVAQPSTITSIITIAIIISIFNPYILCIVFGKNKKKIISFKPLICLVMPLVYLCQ